MGGQLRKDYFLDQYVVIAPGRTNRPSPKTTVKREHEAPGDPDIVQERGLYQLKNQAGDWIVKVIANKYPALTPTTPAAFGKQEVIIETPEHDVEFSELSLTQIERIFSVYIKRALTMYHLSGIRYVSVFKNDGPRAGASIRHAHSQIIGLPIIPPVLHNEAQAAAEYASQHGRSVYGDIIRWEQAKQERVVYEDDHVIAITPYASKNPYELWILPKSDTATFAALTGVERRSIATVLKQACGFLDSQEINFNFFLQDAVMHEQQRFILKIEPRKTVWAGLELATGIIINPVSPEQAAKDYRAFIKKSA
jgi:UDPglucose--hexose-1-phosphate uridylyltransferase